MCLFVQWKELLITQQIEKYVKTTMLLKNAGIAYREQIQNIGHGSRRSGQIGSLGEKTSYSIMYQIYVKKADLEQANAIISRNQIVDRG